MTFVTIPALIGPMLGPVAGGLIVGYFHWRVIFFVNLPIGLLGLALVFRRLPDYRADGVDKLDVFGGVLFGCGIGLLSYILEVFGEHTLATGAILGLFALSVVLLARLLPARHRRRAPPPPARPLPHPDVPVGRDRQLHHAARRGRDPVPPPAPLPGRPRLHARAVGLPPHAAVHRRDGAEAVDAAHPRALRLPARAPREHDRDGRRDRPLRDDRRRHSRRRHRRPRARSSAPPPRCSTPA